MMNYKKKAIMMKEMEAIEDLLMCRMESLSKDLERYVENRNENPDDDYWHELVDEFYLRLSTLSTVIDFIAEDTKYLPWNKDLNAPF